MAEALLFVGPSGRGLAPARLAGIDCRPPARRGDIERAIAPWRHHGGGPRPAIVLCDGIFASAPAVGHGELCEAIDAGFQVWGVSSIGAIRAHELRREGMHGFGWVYEQFARHADFTDDEMCLLHLPGPGYEPLSEPLVNVRHALARRGAALGITPRAANALLRDLGTLWFGDRSHELIMDLLCGPLGQPAEAARGLIDELVRRPVKRLDLERLLRVRPWRAAQRRPPARR